MAVIKVVKFNVSILAETLAKAPVVAITITHN